MQQAIATWYHKRRFRSRLEARWAVFFDTLGLGWDYERYPATGYLSLNYCPDFWLEDLKLWVEIKSSPEFYTQRVQEKIYNLVDHTREGAVVLIGDFYGGTMPTMRYLSLAYSDTQRPTMRYWTDFQWVECQDCGCITVGSNQQWRHPAGTHRIVFFEESERLTAAFDAARGYNFDTPPMGPVTVVMSGGIR